MQAQQTTKFKFKIKPSAQFIKYRFLLRDDLTGEYIIKAELEEPSYDLPATSIQTKTNYSWKMQGKTESSSTWINIIPLINLEQQRSSNGKFYQLEWPRDESAEIYRLLIRDQERDEIVLKYVLMDNKFMLDISNINTDVTYYRAQIWKDNAWVDLTRYAPIRIIKDESLFKKILETKDIPMDLELFLALQKEYENKRFVRKKSQSNNISSSKSSNLNNVSTTDSSSSKSSNLNNVSTTDSSSSKSSNLTNVSTTNGSSSKSSNLNNVSTTNGGSSKSSNLNNVSTTDSSSSTESDSSSKTTIDYAAERASGQAKLISDKFDLKGKRVLDIGCDRGQCALELAQNNDCHITAIDIFSYPEWEERSRSNLEFVKIDIGSEPLEFLGKFDYIYSLVVWEHVAHPYAMLKATRKLLADKGKFFLRTNLYCGTIASHVFNDVYFPWPHLLFPDEVFEQFYISQGLSPRRPSWVNNLTVAHYLFYFNKLGFKIDNIVYDRTPIDETFYKCFEDKLGRYTRFDLETDFLNAELSIL